MAKHYSHSLWDAIRGYWENTNASYLEAAKAVANGGEHPNKSIISTRSKAEGWIKKDNLNVHLKTDGINSKTDGETDGSELSQSLTVINNRARKQADVKQAKTDGLADIIINNVHLSQSEIDDLCTDFRAGVLQRHRGDFNDIQAVVDKCVILFRKAVDVISEGGYVSEDDVIERDGFVHKGLKKNLGVLDATIKAMLNIAGVKNIVQTNERKSYGLETYEEPNSGGDLSKKALSQEYMGNHYERIRLSKSNEREAMLERLKKVAVTPSS